MVWIKPRQSCCLYKLSEPTDTSKEHKTKLSPLCYPIYIFWYIKYPYIDSSQLTQSVWRGNHYWLFKSINTLHHEFRSRIYNHNIFSHHPFHNYNSTHSIKTLPVHSSSNTYQTWALKYPSRHFYVWSSLCT